MVMTADTNPKNPVAKSPDDRKDGRGEIAVGELTPASSEEACMVD